MSDGPAGPPEPSAYRRRLVILLTTIVVVVVVVAVASADRRIDVSADELLNPLAEVSPAGFIPLPLERVYNEDGYVWRRSFQPRRPADYGFLAVDVIVASGRSYDLDDHCEWHGNQLPITSETLTAPPYGGVSEICRYTFPGDWRVLRYQVVTRNALIHVQTSVTPSIDDATAITLIVSLARRQLDIIERLAPRRWW